MVRLFVAYLDEDQVNVAAPDIHLVLLPWKCATYHG